VISRIAVLAVLLFLAACQGNDGGQQAAPTTVAPTTTTPDPAVTACREHVNKVDLESQRVDIALDQLVLSRDSRIVVAAREVETIVQDRELDPDAIAPNLDLEYANAELELARACKTAGYL
jgi:hypothetical protein